MENNKKEKIISTIIVIILLVTVVGVSYSMFSFSSDGTKENVINTGNVAITYNDRKLISLEGAYPVTDQVGIASSDNAMEFTIDANISGKINIKYELGLVEVVEGKNLKASNIKFVMYEDNSMIIGTPDAGVLLSDYASKKGDLIGSYYLTGGNFSSTSSKNYKIVAWIDNDYKVPSTVTNNGNGSHTAIVNTERFSFKVQIKAVQA